jgi:large subunit ribosomal protein L24
MAQNKQPKIRIKTGDTVLVLSGNYKDKIGVVKAVIPATYRAVVEGVNKIKRHVKPTAQQPGGIVEREAPIHISNLMLVDGDNKAGRIKIEVREGKKVRVSKKTGLVFADPNVKELQS